MPWRSKLGILLGTWIALHSLPVSAAEIPAWLPKYDLDIGLDIDGHAALVRERVTWFNRHPRQSTELVFNAHAHYKLPADEVGKTAKILELLRMSPNEAIDFEGYACDVRRVEILGPNGPGQKLQFGFRPDNETALVVALPRPINQGESVSFGRQFIRGSRVHRDSGKM